MSFVISYVLPFNTILRNLVLFTGSKYLRERFGVLESNCLKSQQQIWDN